MRSRDESIKRDLEASDNDADKLDPTRPVGGQVRIMTAHASKVLRRPSLFWVMPIKGDTTLCQQAHLGR